MAEENEDEVISESVVLPVDGSSTVVVESSSEPVVQPSQQIPEEQDPVLTEIKKIRKSVARQARELRRIKKDDKVASSHASAPPDEAVNTGGDKKSADPFDRFFRALGTKSRRNDG
jgi:hypothetical protein